MIKKLYTVVLSLVLCLLMISCDDSIKVGNLSYALSDSTASVIQSDSYKNLRSITIPEKIEVKGKDYKVTSIGFGAFKNCSGLLNVEIPESVTVINSCAFMGCCSLTNIKIPSSVTSVESLTFANCTELINVEIPSGVIRIGDSAFSFCESLNSIDIPVGTTEIGSTAFGQCTSLSKIEIPYGITKIEKSTFMGCERLLNIEIPPTVAKIEEFAFSLCNNLDVVIYNSESNVEVDPSAFQMCGSVSYRNSREYRFKPTLSVSNKIRYESMDLGLPSGLLWATTNIGATSIEGYGNLYSWGESSSKNNFGMSNYSHYKKEEKRDKDGFSYGTMIGGYTKYVKKSDSNEGFDGYYDDKNILEKSDDAAHVFMGENWRMPTSSEFKELKENCKVAWCTYKGIAGYKFTGKNGNWIFLPAAGYCGSDYRDGEGIYGNYWSSSLNPGSSCYADGLYFNSKKIGIGKDDRSDGYSVRGVKSSK